MHNDPPPTGAPIPGEPAESTEPAGSTEPVESTEPAVSTESADTAALLTDGEPGRSRRRSRWRVAAIVTLVVALIASIGVGGFFGVVELLTYRQRQAYDAGHAAYAKADCAAAMPQLAKALDKRLNPKVAGYAAHEQEACRAYLDAMDRAGRVAPAKAVTAHLDYLATAMDVPLRQASEKAVLGLVEKTPAGDLAGKAFCERLPDLRGVVETARPDLKALPALMLGCAKVWEQAKADTAADDLYRLVRKDYPKTKHADQALRGIVRIAYRQAKREGPKEKWSVADLVPRFDPSLDGKVRITLYNDSVGSPGITLMLSGKDVVVKTTKVCKTCKRFPTADSAFCRFKGPSITVTVRPGRYTVVGGMIGNQPEWGHWDLLANASYTFCWISYEKE